ncbi:MAG: NAD(P)H-hydrate dehydratase [Christensenellales bacterium]|jgi:hydroxyethylthiazole kinase-like uncharacterized protein yjeF
MAYKVVTPLEMRQADQDMINKTGIPSLILMENAARGMADILELKGVKSAHIICGRGNNGGDGLALARQLIMRGMGATVSLVEGELSSDAKANLSMLLNAGISVSRVSGAAQVNLAGCDAVVDALFGTGLNKEVSGVYIELIRLINSCGKRVFSADIPSGIDAKNAHVLGEAVKAEVTVTFGYKKIGQLLFPGREYCGEVHVVNIGLPPKGGFTIKREQLEPHDIKSLLPPRKQNSHKGTYGRTAIIAGSMGMAGAGILAARAALAAGAGMVTLGVPKSVVPVVQSAEPCVMAYELDEREGRLYASKAAAVLLLENKNCAAIGPGLGYADALELIEYMMLEWKKPMVIDADAINILAENGIMPKGDNVIITPHPAEFSRFTGISQEEVLDNPLGLAEAFSKEHGVITLIKGASTVIASPDGRSTINTSGCPGMAKAGSGDVLTGIITALLAQGLSCYDAARLGAYVAGLSGERAQEKKGRGMTALDTIFEVGGILG